MQDGGGGRGEGGREGGREGGWEGGWDMEYMEFGAATSVHLG